MRNYYDEEFAHIIDYHPEEIMVKLKLNYQDEVFEVIERYLLGDMTDSKLVAEVKDYLIAAAELLYETHDFAECRGY